MLGARIGADSDLEYRRFVLLGDCPGAEVAAKDAPRTLRGAKCFPALVSDDAVQRLLHASAHDHLELVATLEAAAADTGGRILTGKDTVVYAQGMNRVAGVLLLVMTEVEAFECLRAVRRRLLPAWWTATGLPAVSEACACVRRAVSVLDPTLFDALEAATSGGEDWAGMFCWPRLTSLYALPRSDDDLAEVVSLWDGIFALGGHALVLLCAADLLGLGDRVLAHAGPLLAAEPPRPGAAAKAKRAVLGCLQPDSAPLSAREQLDSATSIVASLPQAELAQVLEVCAGSERLRAAVAEAEATAAEAHLLAKAGAGARAGAVAVPATSGSGSNGGSGRAGLALDTEPAARRLGASGDEEAPHSSTAGSSEPARGVGNFWGLPVASSDHSDVDWPATPTAGESPLGSSLGPSPRGGHARSETAPAAALAAADLRAGSGRSDEDECDDVTTEPVEACAAAPCAQAGEWGVAAPREPARAYGEGGGTARPPARERRTRDGDAAGGSAHLGRSQPATRRRRAKAPAAQGAGSMPGRKPGSAERRRRAATKDDKATSRYGRGSTTTSASSSSSGHRGGRAARAAPPPHAAERRTIATQTVAEAPHRRSGGAEAPLAPPGGRRRRPSPGHAASANGGASAARRRSARPPTLPLPANVASTALLGTRRRSPGAEANIRSPEPVPGHGGGRVPLASSAHLGPQGSSPRSAAGLAAVSHPGTPVRTLDLSAAMAVRRREDGSENGISAGSGTLGRRFPLLRLAGTSEEVRSAMRAAATINPAIERAAAASRSSRARLGARTRAVGLAGPGAGGYGSPALRKTAGHTVPSSTRALAEAVMAGRHRSGEKRAKADAFDGGPLVTLGPEGHEALSRLVATMRTARE